MGVLFEGLRQSPELLSPSQGVLGENEDEKEKNETNGKFHSFPVVNFFEINKKSVTLFLQLLNSSSA